MEATDTTSVRQAANVGDTVLDLNATHNAGTRWNIGVLSGAHDRQLLERAPHTHILQSITELLNHHIFVYSFYDDPKIRRINDSLSNKM